MHSYAIHWLLSSPTHGMQFMLQLKTHYFTIVGLVVSFDVSLVGGTREWEIERELWMLS